MSGGGRCNFTNLHIEPDNFLSHNSHFCKSALSCYTQWDFIELVKKHGIAYHEKKHGQLFCNNSSKDILNMLLAECESANVHIRTQCDVTSVSHNSGIDKEGYYQLETIQGIFSADALVIACGGLSIPTMGASGFGYEIAKQFSLNVLPTTAALVPFTFSDYIKPLSERLAGVSVDVVLSNSRASFRENILFTHRGLSGPAVLQLSSYWKQVKILVLIYCQMLTLEPG